MAVIVKQISSLEKVRRDSNLDYNEITEKALLKGERFSYQIALNINMCVTAKLSVESEIKDYVKVYLVENAVMDMPYTEPEAGMDNDYITKEPGLMPDILIPLSERENVFISSGGASSLWVEINLPEDIKEGKYPVTLKLEHMKNTRCDIEEGSVFEKTMNIEVIDEIMPAQKLIYTRWFYVDCIADYHKAAVYSDAHFDLIEKYIRAAREDGVNMILVPIHTPPLDTAFGTQRTCVQLVDITKEGEKYFFNFDKFKRFISICKKCDVEYYEMAHMFSQWGAEYAPNIKVTENGVCDYKFGWHVSSKSSEYIEFLKQYIPAVISALKEEGIFDKTYFHISDEPNTKEIEAYKTGYDILKPLIGEAKTFDALSKFDFYEKGLVECPVTSVSHIEEFLEHEIENQWAYYCCGPQYTFTNSTMAMPLSRVRILGFLMYKYNIKGFLHWGLNFYNGRLSLYKLDPYLTTSCHGVFPSGDPFILYPAKDGVYTSIRGKATYEAINDMNTCFALEKYIGREAVVKLIDDYAGNKLKFSEFPRGKEYIETLRDKMVSLIKEYIK